MAAQHERVAGRSGRNMVVDEDCRNSGKHRPLVDAEIRDDEATRPPIRKLGPHGLRPDSLAFADDPDLGRPSATLERAGEKRDGGQPIRVEVTEHQRRPLRREAADRLGECLPGLPGFSCTHHDHGG